MRALALFTRLISSLSRLGVGLAFSLLIVVVTIQIVTRSFGFHSPVWTEEASRYLLLYMTAFGVGLSLLTGEFVNVDLLQESLSERTSWWMRLFANILTAVMGAVMIWPAWRFTAIGAMQRSPSLRWSMDYIHASVLVLAILLFLFAMTRVIGMLAGLDDGRPRPTEEN